MYKIDPSAGSRAVEPDVVPHLIDIRNYIDSRGSLGVVEDADLPFQIRRMYYLFNVPLGAVRGEHGHKKLQQLIICMNGICDITLNNGFEQFPFRLDSPAKALYVPPRMWRSLHFREPSTVCCVLASRPYEKEDYLFTYEEFRRFVRETDGQQA